MRRLLHMGLVLGAAGMALVFGASEARAACTSFTVSAVPNPTQEGGDTTVSVSRIGSEPASIDIDGISGTATSGSDFERVNRTIEFDNQTSVSFKVKIFEDGKAEPQEQFRLHLSNVEGCSNSSYDIGEDEIVRIVASLGSTPSPTSNATPSPTKTPSSTSQASSTTSPSASPTVSPSATPSATETPIPLVTVSPEADDDEGTSALAIAGILIASLAVLAAIALVLYVRRARL